MTNKEITELLARRQDAFARCDAIALAAQYADNCVVESPAFGRLVGRAAVEKRNREFFAAFPDVSFDFGELLIVGDRAVGTTTYHGTDTGGLFGQTPTGRQFRFFVVHLYTFRDSHIAHERRVYDVNGLLLQLATDSAASSETSQRYRAALERTRLEHEVKTAAEIQRALLPEVEYKRAGFKVAAASLPCRAIGGDFFDYFDLPNGTFGFALADVAGKGPPAALLAAQLQGILAAHSYSEGTPAQTVTRVNAVLVRRTIESRFATMFYGQLSCSGRRLIYCNAGHNPPFLVGHRGVQRLERGGSILGAFSEATFEEATLQLDPGDTLVVFSDGVTEALNTEGVEFGEDRLQSCLKSNRELAPAALLYCILGTVRDFGAATTQTDDLTVLVLRHSNT
jgi:serine phosphatase RsbU (regulator of sigma subunit)/ketosteroid isomerase-like protein